LTVPSPTDYPFFGHTRVFDRGLIDCVLCVRPSKEIVKELPLGNLRGVGHLVAANARVIRTSREVLSGIRAYAIASSWKHRPGYSEMQRNLRDFETLILSRSGTIFPPVTTGDKLSSAG